MPRYDVYSDCGEGRRRSRAYSFTAIDDVAAEGFVTERLTAMPVELWCYSRRVARYQGKQAKRIQYLSRDEARGPKITIGSVERGTGHRVRKLSVSPRLASDHVPPSLVGGFLCLKRG